MRIIEIVLFLTPFLGFAAWRMLFPAPLPPIWLIGGLTVFIVVMVTALLWLWHLETQDASQPYFPAELHDGRIVPAHRAALP